MKLVSPEESITTYENERKLNIGYKHVFYFTRVLENSNMRVEIAEKFLLRSVVDFFLICIVGGGIKVHSTLRPLKGLLCHPRVIMIMEKSVE
jgi:hypothetical protein